ncbi:hypothetical protein [Reichenbachiella sp.]|uniref:hypothetical protein n=1 Tax=Reichenbachiella sp. TaxID=2184521 RepID=UPI003B592F84
MKNFLQSVLLAFSLVFIASCSSEDPEPVDMLLDTNEVGTWYLNGFIFSGVEEAYDSYNNTQYDISLLSLNDGSPLVYYELTMEGDSVFERKQKYYGYQVLRDTGVWVLDSLTQVLTLESDLLDEEDFEVLLNENDDLYMSQKTTFPMIRDDSIDALEARYPVDSVRIAYFNDSLSDDERAAYYKNVPLDLVFAFSREE